MSAALPLEAMREILPEFTQESLDWMAQAEAALLELEADAFNVEAVNVVLRAFHTVKGTSAFLGLDVLSGLAHDAESLLTAVRDDGVSFTRTHADLLLAAADATRALLEHARASIMQDAAGNPPEETYDTLRAQLRAVHGTGGVPVATDVAAASDDGHDHTQAWTADAEWTRVRTRRLDDLLDLVGELVVAQSMVAQDAAVAGEPHGSLAGKVLQQSKIVRELQALGLGLRMVPLRPLFQRMQRLVRELSHQSGKDVTLITEGADTGIDRRMVEALADPLVHMIRNAIDHGIEPADERVSHGKPAHATLRLSASHAGGAVVIELQDDGRGLDRARILATAAARGLVTDGREPGDDEVWQFIFAPGLSTSESVTDLSGRGVGMDVVQRSIESLRGRIDIDSAPGTGTRFTIRLPLTTAITDGLLVRVGAERYIVPSMSVRSSFRPAADAVVVAASVNSAAGCGTPDRADAGGSTAAAHAPTTASSAAGAELVMVQNVPLPIVRLHGVFGVADAETNPARAVLVVIEEGRERFALLVDELLGQQQFVVKPLAGALQGLPGVAGSAVLSDGRVGLILDPAGLRGVMAVDAAGSGPNVHAPR